MPLVKAIKGFTRILGKAQGYLGLPVRDEVMEYGYQMTTAWEFTEDELKCLNEGKALYITLLGQAHPPIILKVEE